MTGFRARASSDEGAVLPLVAISIFVLVLVGAVALDLGGAWETKRDMVPDVESAALAAARVAAADHPDCAEDEPAVVAAAEELYTLNAPDADVDDLEVRCVSLGDGRLGYVEVAALQPSLVSLGRLVRDDDIDVAAGSAARWGPSAVGTGLKPFTVCAGDPDVAQVFTEGPDFFDDYFTDGDGHLDFSLAAHEARLVEFPVNKGDDGNLCERDSPPSWGWTCLGEDGSCNSNRIRDIINDGAQNTVRLPSDIGAGDGDCNASDPSDTENCASFTGSLGASPASAIDAQVCSFADHPDPRECPLEKQWTIVVHDEYIDSPPRQYVPAAFLSFVIREAAALSGNPNQRELTVEYINVARAGEIDPTVFSTVSAVEMCWADSDIAPAGETCSFGS